MCTEEVPTFDNNGGTGMSLEHVRDDGVIKRFTFFEEVGP